MSVDGGGSEHIWCAMTILLIAALAFLIMRLAIPLLKAASNLMLATFAVPCAGLDGFSCR